MRGPVLWERFAWDRLRRHERTAAHGPKSQHCALCRRRRATHTKAVTSPEAQRSLASPVNLRPWASGPGRRAHVARLLGPDLSATGGTHKEEKDDDRVQAMPNLRY